MRGRYYIREEYKEYPAHGCGGCFMVGKWTFHYNDGTKETVTKRWRA
jgi:hypothetical protein